MGDLLRILPYNIAALILVLLFLLFLKVIDDMMWERKKKDKEREDRDNESKRQMLEEENKRIEEAKKQKALQEIIEKQKQEEDEIRRLQSIPTKTSDGGVLVLSYVKEDDDFEFDTSYGFEGFNYPIIYSKIASFVRRLYADRRYADIHKIVFNIYGPLKDGMGNFSEVCIGSFEILTERCNLIKWENLTPAEVIRNFRRALGASYDKKSMTWKFWEISPFDEHKKFLEVEDSRKGPWDPLSLDPIGFERSVKDLFEKMGFSVKSTKVTGDGGIDLVAVNSQPVYKGKYIIQCKRYSIDNKVSEVAVRDLYGVVNAEDANKGILVTTSDFTKSARTFADGKPIELICGNVLKELFSKYCPAEKANDISESASLKGE